MLPNDELNRHSQNPFLATVANFHSKRTGSHFLGRWILSYKQVLQGKYIRTNEKREYENTVTFNLTFLQLYHSKVANK